MSKITVEQIQRAAAQAFGITMEELLGIRRSWKYARPRQVAMMLSRELTKRSLPNIGQMFNRDHTTVLHALRRIPELCRTNQALQKKVEQIRGEVLHAKLIGVEIETESVRIEAEVTDELLKQVF